MNAVRPSLRPGCKNHCAVLKIFAAVKLRLLASSLDGAVINMRHSSSRRAATSDIRLTCSRSRVPHPFALFAKGSKGLQRLGAILTKEVRDNPGHSCDGKSFGAFSPIEQIMRMRDDNRQPHQQPKADQHDRE